MLNCPLYIESLFSFNDPDFKTLTPLAISGTIQPTSNHMRSIQELQANLLNLGKQASADPTSVTDPAEAGGPATPSAENLRTADGPNGLPAPAATLADTVDAGAGVPSPATQDFVEPGKVASNFIESAKALREKFASGSWSGAAAPAPAPAATPAAAPAKTAAATDLPADFVPGNIHLKIAAHLLETEQGRMLTTTALEEVLGKEAAAELVKEATSEQQQFEKAYLVEKLAAAEQAEKYAAAYAQRLEQEAAVENMIKQATVGMSGEEATAYREKVATSAQIISRAEAAFAENPDALAAFTYGVVGAHKYAAAVEAGADPAAAMADPEAGGDPAAAGPEAPPSPEEIANALMELVQAGVITEEQAEQLLQAVAGGGAGGPPPEAGGDPAAAGGPPPEEDPAKMAAIDEHLSKVAAVAASFDQ